MQWKLADSRVTGGGSWWAKSVNRRSGAFAPRGRTMIGPNRPRNVLSVWLGPWSWYGHAPTDWGVHSHWYVNDSPGAMNPPARVYWPM